MATRALLIDSDPSGDALTQALRHAAPELEVQVHCASDVDAAVEDLRQCVVAGAPPLLIVLGPGVANPVACARRLHHASPLSYLVFLTDDHQAVRLQQALSPISLIGSQWCIARPASNDLAEALRSATRSARQRQHLRTTLDCINVQLASQPAGDVGERRHHAVSDRFLACVLEHAHDAIIAADTQGVISTWNRAAAELFGVEERDAVGRPIQSIALGEWEDQVPALIEGLREGRLVHPARDLQCRRADGAVFEAELVVTPVLDDAGRQVGVSAIVRDITDRKRNDQALRQSEARVRLIVESALDAVITINEEGRVTGWNPQAEAIFRWRREEVLGRPLANLIIPEHAREAHRKGLQRFLDTGEGPALNKRLELTALRKGGEEFPVELTIASLRLGDRYEFSAFVRDITERKRLDELFQTTVESAPTAMVMSDQAGTIVLVNAEAEKLFGYSRRELLGQPVEALVPTRFRSDHPRLRRGFFAAPEARRMGAGRDLFAVRKDGSEFPVEIGLNPITTRDGMFVLSAIVDITERKRLEETLRNMNQALEQRVAQRTAELARSNEALERSNLELQRFAYIASHDLQSPLRSIAGCVQLLQQDYGERLGKEATLWISRAVENTKRMQTLIQDLLSYARVDSTGRPLEPTDVRAVFNDAVAALEVPIRETSAEVTCSDLPTVPGDRSQLVQLFQNLLDNGLKYRGPDPPRIHVSAEPRGSEWLFAVRDNGIGIDSKHKERIFEVFQRLHTHQTYPGTGIGLAICRRVVLRHGGRIWMEPHPGGGSVFYFTIADTREVGA